MLDRSRYKLPASLAGARLDHALAELIPEESRSWLQKLVRKGGVQRNGGVVVRSVAKLDAGDVLDVDFAPGSSEYELPIVYEDEHLVAIDKPAGLMVHENQRTSGDTVASLAARRWPDLPALRGAHRPGIVHRLDRETSGVMLLAKNEATMTALGEAFAERLIGKTYGALTHGAPPTERFEVDARLIADSTRLDLQIVAAPGAGRDAQTHFEVLESYGDFSYLACHPRTGRRHQIRAHLTSRGFPIVGDRLYGSTIKQAPPGAAWPARQALHARRLELTHPRTGQALVLEAPWPRDLERTRRWFAARAAAGERGS